MQGVSTRAVDELVQALGIGTGISRSEGHRICTRWTRRVGAFRDRRLDHTGFPFVYLDATYLHVRDDHHVVSKAVVIATGVSAEGMREVLGFDVGDSEDEVFWRGFLASLRKRGLSGVQPGHLRPARRPGGGLERCFQGAAHQRCRVHFARNLLASVPKCNTRWWPRPFAPCSPTLAEMRWPSNGTRWPMTFRDRFGKAARP